MQLKINESLISNNSAHNSKLEISGNSMMSVPSALCASKIFSKDIDLTKSYCVENSQSGVLTKIWNRQHPLIHTWLVLSSVSICFLFAFFFIIS